MSRKSPAGCGAAPREALYVFRLYVTRMSPVSARAVANARRLLGRYLPGRHRLDILNVDEHVDLARADEIIACPTLLRASPEPRRRFVGDLSEAAALELLLASSSEGCSDD